MADAGDHWHPRNARYGAEEEDKKIEKPATSFTFYSQTHFLSFILTEEKKKA